MMNDDAIPQVAEANPPGLWYTVVTDPRYEEDNRVSCFVTFTDGVTAPFTCGPNDNMNYARDIYARVVAGDFGPVAKYVPPTPEQLRAKMPTLAKWRVEAIIDLHNLRAMIDAAIDALPEPQRTTARSKRQYVTEFSRVDPLFSIIGQAVSKTPEEIDTLWLEAAAL